MDNQTTLRVQSLASCAGAGLNQMPGVSQYRVQIYRVDEFLFDEHLKRLTVGPVRLRATQNVNDQHCPHGVAASITVDAETETPSGQGLRCPQVRRDISCRSYEAVVVTRLPKRGVSGRTACQRNLPRLEDEKRDLRTWRHV
jgi:hypothetical protein